MPFDIRRGIRYVLSGILTTGIAATTRTVMGVVLLAVQSTLTIILAILIVIGAIGSCLHKRKPLKVNRRSNEIDDDLQPLSVPTGGYAAELQPYPTRGGYMPAATSEGYDHRASTIYKSPYINKDTPIYEEYSSSYRSSRAPSVATRNSSVGHGRVGSIGPESAFQYRPVGSPPLPPGGRRESYSMR
jgi:hypothetical protein